MRSGASGWEVSRPLAPLRVRRQRESNCTLHLAEGPLQSRIDKAGGSRDDDQDVTDTDSRLLDDTALPPDETPKSSGATQDGMTPLRYSCTGSNSP
ncbi:hypothetical protein Scani_48310 [Streptomyces caniferus]|uniref:Uncharacterized protein n=1 Tax=Streptomyces caniferus TaxID=285557 RepID=A0A640SAY1_9ACTN|nr:hypothetical protein Scani_48310 [Streptomyces caniferus]